MTKYSSVRVVQQNSYAPLLKAVYGSVFAAIMYILLRYQKTLSTMDLLSWMSMISVPQQDGERRTISNKISMLMIKGPRWFP